MGKTINNILYTISYQLLAILIPFITTPYISRILGVENIGIYSYTMSIVQYFMLVAMLGVSDHGNRSIAAKHESRFEISKYFWNIYTIQLSTSICAIAGYIFICHFLSPQYTYISILQSLYLISCIFDINWFFWGLEKFKITVTRNFFIKIISVILIFGLVKKPTDLPIYVMIMAISTLISNVILWLFVRKELIWVRPSTKEIVRNLKPCLILFVPLVARSIFVYMDKILLGFLCPITQVGFYENSEKIILAPTSILTALGTVMLPKLSNLIHKKLFDTGQYYTQVSMHYIMLLGCGFSFGIAAIAPVFAPVFFGPEFQECADIMKIMAFTIILVGIANVLRTQCLVPRHYDRVYVFSVILGAIINLIVDLLLIPRLGAIGASIGWLMAELTITLYQSIMANKWLPIIQYYKETSIYFLIGGIMFFTLKILFGDKSPSIIILVTQIIVGSLLYIFLFLIYCLVNKNSFASKLLLDKIYTFYKKIRG